MEQRVIKFRAWDAVTKEMSEGFEIQGQGLRAAFKSIETTVHHILQRPGRFTLQRFTGLTDKNGREIYDGDIVRLGQLAVLRQVKLAFGCWNLFIGSKSDELLYPAARGYRDGGQHNGIQVIGNIYENPELLTK